MFCFLLFAFFLWAISLQHVPVQSLNGLGLISGLSPSIIAALVILTISFGLALQQPQMKVSILALHLDFCHHYTLWNAEHYRGSAALCCRVPACRLYRVYSCGQARLIPTLTPTLAGQASSC